MKLHEVTPLPRRDHRRTDRQTELQTVQADCTYAFFAYTGGQMHRSK